MGSEVISRVQIVTSGAFKGRRHLRWVNGAGPIRREHRLTIAALIGTLCATSLVSYDSIRIPLLLAIEGSYGAAMAGALFGTYQHKLDIGVGGVFNIVESGKQSLPPFDGAPVGGSFNIGYRYTPPAGGLMVRVGFSPIFGAGGFWPWGGVSVGYQF